MKAIISSLLVGLCCLTLQAFAQRASVSTVLGYTVAPDYTSVEVRMFLNLFGPRPAAIAPGNSTIVLRYDPLVFDPPAAGRLAITARGPWDVTSTPAYYDSATVERGPGNTIIIRINSKDVANPVGLPNIGRGTGASNLVAAFRLPLRPLPGICGRVYDIDYALDPKTACLGTVNQTRLMNVTLYGKDESEEGGIQSVTPDRNFVPGQRVTIPVSNIVLADQDAIVRIPGRFNYAFDDARLTPSQRGIRYKVVFTPDPAFGCPNQRQVLRDITKTNPDWTQPLPTRQELDWLAPTCNGTPVNSGTVTVVSYNVCGDSAVSAPFPVRYEACFPYVFQPAFATSSRTSICQGEAVNITVDSSVVRIRRGTSTSRVPWGNSGASLNWISYDGGASWVSATRFVFSNLWENTQGNTARIKILVRDRGFCISDTFFVNVALNKPNVPNSGPSITTKTNQPSAYCADGRVQLDGVKVGDQAPTYTWSIVSGGGALFNAATGGTPNNALPRVFYEKPAGYIGLVRIAYGETCYGTKPDTITLNFSRTPSAAANYTSSSQGAPGTVALGVPVTLRATSTTNAADVLYRWTIVQGSNTEVTTPSTSKEYVTAPFNTVGRVTVTLRASTPDGNCFSDSTFSFEIAKSQTFFVPTAFSPSEKVVDEKNRTFRVFGEDISGIGFQMVVMDRWGVVVFESTNPQQFWDGRDKSGKECVQGNYAYAVKGEFNDGTKFERTGLVNLIK